VGRLFYKDKPIIGLDISQTGIKVMAVDPKKWLVLGYGSVDLDPSKVQKSLESDDGYLAENIKSLMTDKLVGQLPSDHVVVGVPTSRTFSRTFTVPAKAEATLADAVEIEVDQYIPIPMSALYVDYAIIERTKDQLTIIMSAVPRVLVDSCLVAVKSAGLTPIMIEPGTLLHESLNPLKRDICRHLSLISDLRALILPSLTAGQFALVVVWVLEAIHLRLISPKNLASHLKTLTSLKCLTD
jgi:Tfp pilus assembly PilM family ATPase